MSQSRPGPRKSGAQKNSSTGISGVWSSKYYDSRRDREITVVYAWVPHPDKPRRGLSTTFKVGSLGKGRGHRSYMEAIELAKKWRSEKLKEIWGREEPEEEQD